MASTVTSKERSGGIYTNDINVRDHHFYADEPESLGGSDLGPTPVELLCAGLASCTSITLRMYANRKEWPVEHIAVDVKYKKAGSGEDMRDVFTRTITLTGDLDDAQRERMQQIADKCPVHKILEAEAEIRTELR